MLIKFKRVFASLLFMFVIVMLSSCSVGEKIKNIIFPDEIDEDVINEDVINQVISEEIYLKEIIVVENKISEMLIQDETIEEVVLCKSLYVNEGNIDEFSNHSQTAELFGSNIELAPLIAKISIGTGVIITLTILKVSNVSGLFGGIVISAAPKAIKGALSGAGIGTLIGGLTGTIDSIDETGRTTAVLNFAASVVGVIATAISVINAPLGIAIAGITVAAGLAAFEGYKMVKKITTTNYATIDWNNVDWKKVGYSAAEQSINNAADGFVWGSIIGAVSGGLEGYKKFNADYSTYEQRLKKTPVSGERGEWSSKRGESSYSLKEPLDIPDGRQVTEINYKNAIPDFSDYSIAEVDIPSMTTERYSNKSKNIIGNFEQANELAAAEWNRIKFNGKSNWVADDVEAFCYDSFGNKIYTWHELNNRKTMQLIPTELNSTFNHLGGVKECEIMLGKTSGDYYD